MYHTVHVMCLFLFSCQCNCLLLFFLGLSASAEMETNGLQSWVHLRICFVLPKLEVPTWAGGYSGLVVMCLFSTLFFPFLRRGCLCTHVYLSLSHNPGSYTAIYHNHLILQVPYAVLSPGDRKALGKIRPGDEKVPQGWKQVADSLWRSSGCSVLSYPESVMRQREAEALRWPSCLVLVSYGQTSGLHWGENGDVISWKVIPPTLLKITDRWHVWEEARMTRISGHLADVRIAGVSGGQTVGAIWDLSWNRSSQN